MIVKRRLEACSVLLALGLNIIVSPPPARANTISVNPGTGSVGTVITTFHTMNTTFTPALGPVSIVPDSGTANGALVFDLSFVPRGTTITSATFTMSVGGAVDGLGSPGMFVNEYVAPGPLLSLSNFPQGGSVIGSFTGLPNGSNPGTINVVRTFDVTSFVQSLVNNGTPYPGYQFQYTGSDGGVFINC
jgi:hypothetical protein